MWTEVSISKPRTALPCPKRGEHLGTLLEERGRGVALEIERTGRIGGLMCTYRIWNKSLVIDVLAPGGGVGAKSALAVHVAPAWKTLV